MSSVEAAVETATSSIRDGNIDWGVSMEIVDMITGDLAAAQRMVNSVRLRLKVKDVHVQQLAMTLLETAVKNGDEAVHSAVASRELLDDLAAIGERGAFPDARTQALGLIEQWGQAFRAAPHLLFGATYEALKARDLPFSGAASEVPVVMMPQSAAAPQGNVYQKVAADLDVVAEKVRLCNDMYPHSEGVAVDDALAEVVGFLEACKPRLVYLIEEGAMGALDDDTLAKCFRVHDDLMKVLEAEANHDAQRQPPKGVPCATAAANSSAAAANLLPLYDDVDDDGPALRHNTNTANLPTPAAEPSLRDLDFMSAPATQAPPPPAYAAAAATTTQPPAAGAPPTDLLL